jgi:glycosyltransferase involved in cell wall biosynthesis
MKKKLLIILYTFPPFPGIGGRRWAKFAKYLAAKEHDVHVICCENVFPEQSLWINDVKHENIKIHTLPAKYPDVVLHGPKSLWGKVAYRLWKFYFSFNSKGVVFERTIFWKTQLQQKASEIIEKENISNVIVSIPPYRLATYSLGLKQQYPGINLIVDYRDPWSDNKSFHGFKDISSARLKHEQQLEKKVLDKASKVITVSDKMTEMLKARCVDTKKIVTIANGFDPADIVPSIGNSNTPVSDKIRFIYAGTLYSNIEYIIDPLITYIEKLRNEKSEIHRRISFEFYGNHNLELVNKIERFNDKTIVIHKPLPLEKMQAVLKDSSFCVLMSTPDHSFAFNTKFCEYLANRKPILLFSNPGELPDFIVQNKLGFHVNPSQLEKEMNTFFDNINRIVSNFNDKFDIEPFSIPSLTNEIEKLLI